MSKWFRFLPGVHTVVDGKDAIEAIFIGQLIEDNEADE